MCLGVYSKGSKVECQMSKENEKSKIENVINKRFEKLDIEPT